MKHICIGITAHVDAGKTTLSEAMLFRAGALKKMGRVDHRDAFLDTFALERERGITIFSKQAEFSLPHTEVTLLDTPGHVDFSAEMERTLQVLDYAVLVISGTDGVQAHTETLWRLLARHGIPTFLFVNKMDLDGAERVLLLRELKTRLSSGVVDFGDESTLHEELAVCDETLLERYFEQGTVADEDVVRLIRERKVFPCFFGSALRLDGVDALLDALDRRTVQPEPQADFGARVFKVARDAQGNRLTYMKITGGSLAGPRTAFGRRGRRLAGKGQSAARLFGRKIYRCGACRTGHGGRGDRPDTYCAGHGAGGSGRCTAACAGACAQLPRRSAGRL